jgi:hypothetical protein
MPVSDLIMRNGHHICKGWVSNISSFLSAASCKIAEDGRRTDLYIHLIFKFTYKIHCIEKFTLLNTPFIHT